MQTNPSPSPKRALLPNYTVVELCAGAGGQALGLEEAGFEHSIAIELDQDAARTLSANRNWRIAIGDVADHHVWRPADYRGAHLLAGGVPCPPFSLAGRQLGAADERDLLAWAVELVPTIRPRAVMLENVRGLSMPRFAGYRQRILDRLREFGYIAQWRLLTASDFGVPQLRPRFVLVALQPGDVPYFQWPHAWPNGDTVGTALYQYMTTDGWPGAEEWAIHANSVAPTIVGGSKKHGGADLGPTRTKLAWSRLGVDARGIADAAPGRSHPAYALRPPRLTLPMVARLQGWMPGSWTFVGRKTSVYRQIGNAFPPPVARALGESLRNAFDHSTTAQEGLNHHAADESWLYRALRTSNQYLTVDDLASSSPGRASATHIRRALDQLRRDFDLERVETPSGPAFRLGRFKGFVGQLDHVRHSYQRVGSASPM